MDDFLEPFLSSTSWTDANLHESSSWDDTAASQLDGVLPDHLGAYGGNNSELNSCFIPSDHMIGNFHVPETNMGEMQINSSVFLNPRMKCGLVSEDNQLQQDIQEPIPIQDRPESESLGRHLSFPLVMDDGVTAGSFGQNCDYILTNGSDESLYFQSLVESHSSSTIPHLWQSYSGDPSLDLEPSGLQGFVLNGNFQRNSGIPGKGTTNHELLQLGNFSRSLYENGAMQNPHLPPYIPTIAGLNVVNYVDIWNNQQSSKGKSTKHPASTLDVTQPSGPNISGSNVSTKPRPRARRGQATDPHSIAERLRREKIAERMKNLQELVPNSNKTDKASMLDEIIEYVKFLRLQVKVLSMSRLGATGAVMPLITDIQSQGSRDLLLMSAADADLSETQEIVAFEQEVVKLMESNVTAAMQFLQTKGLCLMPVALASAISARKGSLAAVPPRSSDRAAQSAISRNDEVKVREEQGEHVANHCNRAAAKEEETKKSGNMRNLKSKAY